MAVLYEKRDRKVYIRLNRPETLNAFDAAMNRELREAWLEFRADRDAWVAIVTGEGRAFSSGADTRTLPGGAASAGAPPNYSDFWSSLYGFDSFEAGLEVWKPTIAAINGYCLGIGCTLAITCDFRIASEQAQFGFPEVKLGVPTIMAAVRLPRVVGMGPSLELLLMGDNIDAAEAHRIGLVHRVVPRAQLMATAEEWAERLLQRGPTALACTKEVAIRCSTLPLPDAVRMGEALRRLARTADDASEGGRARRERRPPLWTGH
jgi:enoyl-CoA hydratase/carnithine racemase